MSQNNGTQNVESSPGFLSQNAMREQLERIVSSGVLAHSPRMSRFLRFVAEQEFSGKGGDLNEYMLGVEVFDRGERFDPRVDSVVRADAVRLRAKLLEYYETEGKNDPIRCEIPKGGYRPVFVANVRVSLSTQAVPVLQEALQDG